MQAFPPATCPRHSALTCVSQKEQLVQVKSLVCPSRGRWDPAAPLLAADAVVRRSSSATGSGSRHNSQAYYFLLDQGGAEDIAGQSDHGGTKCLLQVLHPPDPSTTVPPPPNSIDCRLEGAGDQLSTSGDGRNYRPSFGNGTQIHAISLKEGHGTNRGPTTIHAPGAVSKSSESLGCCF